VSANALRGAARERSEARRCGVEMHNEWMDASPQRIEIVEVAARDGLQSDPATVSTADKVELLRRVVAAGVRRAEAVSFVNPTRVPQMADAAAVMAELNRPGVIGCRDEVTFTGLVLNARGLDAAIEHGVDEINMVVVVTDTYAARNQGRSTAELVDIWNQIGPRARDAGLRTSVTLSSTFGCPFEGEVPIERLQWVIAGVMTSPPDELSLADSIGVASPVDVRQRVEAARQLLGDVPLRVHFHNTRNTGLANAVAAVEAGVAVLDASLGGVGGCPFAPRATGNIPTEDLVYLLHRMGYDTGLDLAELCATVPWLETMLGHDVPGLLSRAGTFPAHDTQRQAPRRAEAGRSAPVQPDRIQTERSTR
jgi:hydroxymethylglutaryl-CoA lyase